MSCFQGGSLGSGCTTDGALSTTTFQPGASLVKLQRSHLPSALWAQVGPSRRAGVTWSTARIAAAQNGVRQAWSRTTTNRRSTPRNSRWSDQVGARIGIGSRIEFGGVPTQRCRRASSPTTVLPSSPVTTRRNVTSDPAAAVRRTSSRAKPVGSHPAPTTLAAPADWRGTSSPTRGDVGFLDPSAARLLEGWAALLVERGAARPVDGGVASLSGRAGVPPDDRGDTSGVAQPARPAGPAA